MKTWSICVEYGPVNSYYYVTVEARTLTAAINKVKKDLKRTGEHKHFMISPAACREVKE